MRIKFAIIILCGVIFSQAQNIKGKYFKKDHLGTTVIKIKSGHQYRIRFKYNREEWYTIKHDEPIGKMCIPPGCEKPKRVKIIKGAWKINGDTLFLTPLNYYLVSKEGLKKYSTDGLVIYRKPR